MKEELQLVEDDGARAMVEAALRAGAPDVVAGHELPDGQVIEAARPARRVGISRDDEDAPTAQGWDIRPASEWTTVILLEALRT